MVRRAIFILLITLFLFTGCVRLSPPAPTTVTVNESTYQTGFYGTMFPHRFNHRKRIITDTNEVYYEVPHESFRFVHTYEGSYAEGTIYCHQADYEAASAYYSDPSNYTYYCKINGYPTVIQDIDLEMFSMLLAFAKDSGYSPFSPLHNQKIKKVDLPIPDSKSSPPLIFYKESNDLMFTSSKGEIFHIIDNTLYLVYFYDSGYGLYEKLVAVKVPDEISNYIVEYIKPYL